MKNSQKLTLLLILSLISGNLFSQSCSELWVDLGSQKHIVCGDSVNLFAKTNFQHVDSISWQWTDNDFQTTTISQSTIVFPPISKIYKVQATTPSGCVMTDSVLVNVHGAQVNVEDQKTIACGMQLSIFANVKWQNIFSPIAEKISGVAMPSSDTVFVCGDNGKVFKSTDQGASWTDVSLSVNFDLKSCHFFSSNIGLVCGDNGVIYRTTDGGNTWQNAPTGNAQAINSMFFLNNQTGFAAGGTGSTNTYLYKTVNGGANWSTIGLPNNYVINSLFFHNANQGFAACKNGIIMKTNNGGLQWTTSNMTMQNDLNSILFVDENIGFVCGDNGLILKTDNQGETWTKLNSNTHNNLRKIELTENNDLIIVGDNGTILFSPNYGDDWHKIPIGSEGNVLNINMINHELGFLVGENGKIMKHKNVFNTFQWLPTDNLTDVEYYNTIVNTSQSTIYEFFAQTAHYCSASDFISIEVLPSEVYANIDKESVCGDEVVLYGDFQWKIVENDIGLLIEDAIVEGNLVKAVYGDTLLIISENGSVLKKVKIGTGGGSSFKTVATNNKGSVLAAGYTGVMAQSKDFGFNWSYVITGNTHTINKIVFRDDGFALAVADNGHILKSTDGGTSWTINNTGYNSDLQSVVFLNNGDIIVVGSGGTVLRSTNNGSSFGSMGNLTSSNLFDVAVLPDATIFACGDNGTILKSTNSGLSWTSETIDVSQNYKSIFALTSEIIYLSGDNGVIQKSIDGGENWYIMKSNSTKNLKNISFTNQSAGIALGSNGEILRYDYPNSNNRWIDVNTFQVYNQDVISVFPNETSNYIFQMETSSGCFSSDTTTVIVNPLIVYAGGDVVQTCGLPFEIQTQTNLIDDQHITYQWTPSTYLSNDTIPNPICTPLSNVQYVLHAWHPDGCEAYDTINVFVGSTSVTAYQDTTIYCGEMANLSVELENPISGTTYSWTPSESLNNPHIANPIATPSQTTSYVVIATDPNGCTGTDSVLVKVTALEVFINTQEILSCGEKIQLFPQVNNPNPGLLNWQWTPEVGLNISTIQNPFVSYGGDISYTVTASNSSGECTASASVEIISAPALFNPEICLVSYDIDRDRNLVQWIVPHTNVLDSVKIFRKNDYNQWVLQSNRNHHAGNFWFDPTAIPHKGASEYVISFVDSCGFESSQSDEHKTIFASMDISENGLWNINWTHYQGFMPLWYDVYRAYGNLSFEHIARVPNTATSFVDTTQREGLRKYFIAAENPDSCFTNVNTHRKFSFSNIVSNTPQTLVSDIKVFPNPAVDRLVVSGALLVGSDFEIFDSKGDKVMELTTMEPLIIIPISKLRKGVYHLRIETSVNVIYDKFVKL